MFKKKEVKQFRSKSSLKENSIANYLYPQSDLAQLPQLLLQKHWLSETAQFNIKFFCSELQR